MDLILWRHAEAIEGESMDPRVDMARELTARGRKQAAKMAAWLKDNAPRKLRILVSPSVRTRQTVEALTDTYQVVPALGPDGSVAELLAACGWPDEGGAVLIVGHQPALGRLASLLLGGEESAWTIKKGAVWWFTNRVRNDETQTVLRCALPADLL